LFKEAVIMSALCRYQVAVCLFLFFVVTPFYSVDAYSSVVNTSAAQSLHSAELIARARSEDLAAREQWRKLLFFAPTWFSGEKSLVDDPDFFLAKNGKTDALAELNATLNAFLDGSADERQEALCQYPSRRHWLEQSLNVKFTDPVPSNQSEICKRLSIFKNSVASNKASLVFSSYYPGNPGSLFGHTLLKFAKLNSEGQNTNELLDFGLNHAAHPTTTNPFLYTVMGLSGMFPGYISFMPYYVKVQEYNNSESRDLWEYELSLRPEEVRQALWSVFELSTHAIDYYYFDDNCSLLMLAILEIARPSLKLVDKFDAWVIPGDTIRVVWEYPGLVSQVKYRASNVRRYLLLEGKLSDFERAAFNKLIEGKKRNAFSLAPLEGMTPEQKMRVFDTILEYIDADEQLAGSMEAAKWKNERAVLLTSRAQLGLPSPLEKVEKPQFEAPHEAYPPTRLTLGGILNRSRAKDLKSGALLGWRPALHTLDNPVSGMGADLGIAFFNLEYLVHRNKIWLREFTPLSIETLPVEKPHLSAHSWHFGFGYKQNCFAACGQTTVNFGYGRAWRLVNEGGRIALRADVKAGDDADAGLFVEPGVSAHVNVPFKQSTRWITKFSLSQARSQSRLPVWNHEVTSSFVARPFTPVELEFAAGMQNLSLEWRARSSWYF
jgi:hypothetical protein